MYSISICKNSLRREGVVPVACSIASSLTQLASATLTFSCITTLIVSTFFVTAANLSISARLLYFAHIVSKSDAHDLLYALSFASAASWPPTLATKVRCSSLRHANAAR